MWSVWAAAAGRISGRIDDQRLKMTAGGGRFSLPVVCRLLRPILASLPDKSMVGEGGRMQGLYSVSPALRLDVESVGENIQKELQGKASLLEYITLPEVGQHVVLRFELRGEISSLDELDEIENRLSRLVGEEFWTVLVGDSYRRVKPPLPLGVLPARLEKFAQVVQHKPVPVASTPVAPEIAKDSQIIRSHVPLSPSDWVWEVEVPLSVGVSLPVIRIVSENLRDGEVITIGEQKLAVEYVPNNAGYESLVKAYPLARKAGKSVVRYILERSHDV